MSMTKKSAEHRERFGCSMLEDADAAVIPVMVHLTKDEINAVKDGLRVVAAKCAEPRARHAAKNALRKIEEGI